MAPLPHESAETFFYQPEDLFYNVPLTPQWPDNDEARRPPVDRRRLTSSSSWTSRRRGFKEPKVRFADDLTKVREIPNREEYSSNECFDMWYHPEELHLIKQSAVDKVLVLRAFNRKKQEEAAGKPFSLREWWKAEHGADRFDVERGLEHYISEEQLRETMQLKSGVVEAVLKEQERQRNLDVNDPQRIAFKSRLLSKDSAARASDVGCKDEWAVARETRQVGGNRRKVVPF